MRIAVIDDQPADRDYIAALVTRWAKDRDTAVTAVPFPTSEAFLFAYSEDRDFDILLLDIEMGAINGVELAKTVRKENDVVQMVFITGFPDFIAEGYEVSALHYLMKPVDRDKLFSVLDRAATNLGKAERWILLPSGDGQTRVRLDRILYAEAFGHDLTVHTEDGDFAFRKTIGAWEAELGPEAGFVRCHRSVLVNLRYVSKIMRTDVVLDNGTVLPLARNAAQAVNLAFIRYYREGIE
jgi:DNA-binding LytR/AlgR family response regulator